VEKEPLPKENDLIKIKTKNPFEVVVPTAEDFSRANNLKNMD